MTRIALALAAVAIALPRLVLTPQSSLDGRSFAVAPGVVVELRDIPGPIYVTAEDTDSVSVRIARTGTSGGAAHMPQLHADQRADRIAIYGSLVGPDDEQRIQLYLRVPASVRLEIRRVKGELQVEGGIEGALTAYDVAGAIRATVRGREPVRIGKVSGSVRLRVDAERGRDSIEIDGVAGAIAIVGR